MAQVQVPKSAIAAGGATAALAIATAFVTSYEGERTTPYFDSVGVQTVCRGETHVIMRKYTHDECEAMTIERVKEFQDYVKQSTPGIEKYPYTWASFTSFAYNNGQGTYSNSSVRRLYNQGEYIAACRFIRNYNKAGGQVLTGLVYRRNGHLNIIGEYELCLVDAIPREITK